MLKKLAALVASAGLVMTVACAKTDAGITTNVKSKLAADDTVKAYQINVDTANGVVTLTGTVESSAVKEMAVNIARQTDGVTNVVDQITVNLIAPGWSPTERHKDDPQEAKEQYAAAVPMKRMGVPDDIGEAVAFLASDGANFITGQKISVNGGNSLA